METIGTTGGPEGTVIGIHFPPFPTKKGAGGPSRAQGVDAVKASTEGGQAPKPLKH